MSDGACGFEESIGAGRCWASLAVGLLASAVGGCFVPVHAQDAPPQATELPVTVVTATRQAEALQDIAASVDVVTGASVREAGPLLNLSEALARVPGLGVLNRQNLAQDLQISSRGFGARSTFGVRGVRLYEDGIPLTMPDGQGQTSSFDLTSAQRIEVLRGPASALYGNASGGVVQLFTEDGPPQPEVTVGQAMGRDGFAKTSLKAGGQKGDLNYVVDASQAHTDGFRDHSEATRYQLHTRLQWALDGVSTFTLVGSHMAMPQVADPLGLNASQLAANPRQADPGAEQFNTRKNIYNSQLGGVYERHLGEDAARVMIYGGTRQVTQYQAIPVGAQTPATHPGGVIDLSRRFAGIDARYTAHAQLMARPLTVTGGVSVDQMAEHRRGFRNFDTVNGALGVQGDLRRDEDNTARNLDEYLLTQWDLHPQWQASLGVRHSRVLFDSVDHYIVPGNGDDSGKMQFEATTPTASLLWRLLPQVHLYATAGNSFETPTLNEVAYRSNAGTTTGWNTDLKASQGHHLELGAKAGMGGALQGQVAVYQIKTDDEIAVNVNAGGRATYQNVGHTARQGLEASGRWRISAAWSAQASATWTQANYDDAFTSTTIQNGTPTPTAVAAGKALPGVPRRTAYAELVWRPSKRGEGQGWHSAIEWRHSGRIWANDVNDAYAPSYQLWAWRAGWRHSWSDWRLEALARVDNLLNAHTVGSVIVNEGNRRYYEPAPGRSATLAMYLTRRF